jgi:hypothetical protein
MKRTFLVATFLAVSLSSTTVLTSSNAFAATPMRHELLSSRQLPHWSKYYVGVAQTASCPESTFRKPASQATVREVYVQRSSETLLFERLGSSSDPAKAFTALLDNMTKCPKSESKLDGHTTFQQIHQVQLGKFAVPVRSYSISAAVGSANVSGVVAYARKGRYVFALAELSLNPLNARSFRALLTKAITKIP